jgi:hypothetical protein
MPRARINAPEEEVVLTKPRTRKPRVVDSVEKTAAAPRKRAPARPRISEPITQSEPVRKAPTPLQARQRRRSKKSKSILVVLGICLVLAGSGIGIGVMDTGTIDVIAVVNERNEKITKGEVRDESGNPVTRTIDVQNGDTRPNGGLPMGDPITPPPLLPPETSSSTETATTTTETSSSTESAPDTSSTTPEAI